MNKELKQEYINSLKVEGFKQKKIGKSVVYERPAVKIKEVDKNRKMWEPMWFHAF